MEGKKREKRRERERETSGETLHMNVNTQEEQDVSSPGGNAKPLGPTLVALKTLGSEKSLCRRMRSFVRYSLQAIQKVESTSYSVQDPCACSSGGCRRLTMDLAPDR